MKKQEDLINAIQKFEKSDNPRTSKYLELFSTIVRVTKQGSGLCWESVVECIEKSDKDFEEEVEKIDLTYGYIRRKIGWEEFCNLTGISIYAISEGFEINDREVFTLDVKIAEENNLI